jgi:hypothetical protein
MCNARPNLKKRDVRSHNESEKMCLQYFTYEQADKCFQQEGRCSEVVDILTMAQQGSEAKSTKASDSSSNLQNESVFFSAV